MGFALPEVEILRTLRATFKTHAVNADLLQALFEGYADDPEDGLMLSDIIAMFADMVRSKDPARRLKFIYNYPRQLSDYPCISVTLASDVPFLRPIGKFIQSDEDVRKSDGSFKDPDIVTDDRGVIMDTSYAIGIYTNNPLITVFLYNFIKYFLLVADDSINVLQAFEYQGQDIMPMLDFLPPEIFGRNILLKAEGVFDTAPVKYDRVKQVQVTVVPDDTCKPEQTLVYNTQKP